MTRGNSSEIELKTVPVANLLTLMCRLVYNRMQQAHFAVSASGEGGLERNSGRVSSNHLAWLWKPLQFYGHLILPHMFSLFQRLYGTL